MKLKSSWYLYVIGVFFLLMNSIGVYDFFAVLFENQKYFAEHYTPEIVEYFNGYPLFFRLLWAINLIAAVIAPIMLIFRARKTHICAGICVFADLLLIILTCLFRNRMEVFGNLFTQDLTIFLLFVLFYAYTVWEYRRVGKR